MTTPPPKKTTRLSSLSLSDLSPSDLRGIAQLATQATKAVTGITEGVHRSVSGTLGVPGGSQPERTGGLTGLIYKSVYGITDLVGKGLDTGLAWLEPLLEAPDEATSNAPRRAALVAALNGVMGDRLLADESPFAIPMTLRYQGEAMDWNDPPSMPNATGKIVVLIHGLCVNDLASHAQYRGHATDHGEALASTLDATPVYLRYNSGLPIFQNGRELSSQLEQLITHWPVPVEELTLVAHSMGGLLARSAVYQARQSSLVWPETLKNLVFLGTPHHGAPLEKAGNWLDLLLGSTPYSAPFAKLGKLRSAGITDLRHGKIVEDDAFQALPLPKGVACFTVAATLASQRGTVTDRLTGDGLVPVHSALGHHDDPCRALNFADSSQWIAHRTGHMELLTSPEVGQQLLRWLAPSEA